MFYVFSFTRGVLVDDEIKNYYILCFFFYKGGGGGLSLPRKGGDDLFFISIDEVFLIYKKRQYNTAMAS